jgi:hypothetical protein
MHVPHQIKLGIMQPYFMPYIGYFQLIAKVDRFVIYDDIEFSKKGWINRNRYLLNGKDTYFTIPLAKASDKLNICDRRISNSFEKSKLLRQLKGAYLKAPFFDDTYNLLERIILFDDENLFNFIYNSVTEICRHLGINTEIIISSSVKFKTPHFSQKRVIATCKKLQATTYYNPIGGVHLYDRDDFKTEGIEIKFLRSNDFKYAQFGDTFVPSLSIVDVLMFNSIPTVVKQIQAGVTLE